MPYTEYSKGFRNAIPGIANFNGDGFSRWITLDQDLTIPRYSACFVGVATTGGKITLVSAANTGGKVLGWLQAQKFEDTDIAGPTETGKVVHKSGSKLALFGNAEMEFTIRVDGANLDAIKASIASMKLGSAYGVKVNANGEQVLDPTDVTNRVVVVVDPLRPGKDMVRVKIVPAALTISVS